MRTTVFLLEIALLVILAIGVFAEPPVPNQYLPPNNQGSHSNSYPSSQYGAPSDTVANFVDDNSLSSNYNSNQYSSNSLSTEYGVPEGPSSHQTTAPQYSSPRLASNFGASSRRPSASNRFSSSANHAAPSQLYGAPGRSSNVPNHLSSNRPSPAAQYSSSSSNGFGNYRAPSAQYSAPASSGRFSTGASSQYRASSASSGRYSAASSPSTQYGAPVGEYDINALKEDDLAEPANYEFNFEVQDDEFGTQFGQEETRQDEKAQGSYHVLLPDGRTLIVEYQADEEGYRPIIRYEEPTGGYPSSQRNQGGPY